MAFLRTIRVRLTLWYLLLLAVTLAVFCAALYFAMRQSLYENLEDSLESRAELVTGLVVGDGAIDVEGVEIPGDPIEGEEFVRIYDSSGDLVYDNTGERFRPPVNSETVDAALSGQAMRTDAAAGGVSLRVITAPIKADSEIVGAVEVGLSDGDVNDTLNRLLLIIAIAYPLALILAGAGGVFLAGRALSPIDDVTQAARRITAEDLSQRLDLDLPDDEVGRLARTFDDMIARLDEAFRRQRQFTADASHELRTPLTAIKGQTEVALQRERDPEEYRDVLRTVNSEVDRMTRLVGSLLTMARADARQIPMNKQEVALGELVADAVEQVRPAANEKGISITLQGPDDTHLTADQDLLLQLVLNLLDNAVKYTPSGGVITVSWRQDRSDAVVEVSDNGPGIAAEHLPHVFDRFYRVDAARTRAEGGSGLGLSICQWIAEAHGGSIACDSALGSGSTFTVRLAAS